MIAQEIFRCLPDYDGIVVLHGTDTMAYTASMLSFMLRYVDKPVVITGSQYPLDTRRPSETKPEARADHAASGVAGVFVVFDRQIMLGCRVGKVRTTSQNAFESINRLPVGVIRRDQVRLIVPPERTTLPPALDDAIEPNVFLLKLIPGTRPEVFDDIARLGYRGVVIEGFGLGGLHCLRRNLLEGHSKVARRQRCGAAQCRYEPSDPTVYETGRLALELGIMRAYDMTSECAVTKLMWALGHTADLVKVREMMYTDYCGRSRCRKAYNGLFCKAKKSDNLLK